MSKKIQVDFYGDHIGDELEIDISEGPNNIPDLAFKWNDKNITPSVLGWTYQSPKVDTFIEEHRIGSDIVSRKRGGRITLQLEIEDINEFMRLFAE